MNLFRFGLVSLLSVLSTIVCERAWAEPKVQILSPKDGSQITQDEKSVLVSGKVARDIGRSGNVDILFVIDVSGSSCAVCRRGLG
jgi:hypothetical protein